MTARHRTRCARGTGTALGVILATIAAAVLPAALGSPGTYAATAVAPAHPHAPCWTVGVFLADVGCGFRTTTGRIGFSIQGVDAWYAVSYLAPGAPSWSVCVEGGRRALVDIKGVCDVPIGSMVQADILGLVGVIAVREQP